ncbi:hypothetical protein ACFL9T_15965 [Thermodesulfobacteriota bacterium]
MFNEYKNMLSWSEIKRLNSWEELHGLSNSQKKYFIMVSMLKALLHWQVWVSMAFLALCAYLGDEFGTFFGLKFGIINFGTMFWGAIGAFVYSIVHLHEAKKHLGKLMKEKGIT